MNRLDDEALDRAAQVHGIAASYTDVWGNTHAVAAETKRALLQAMGFDPAQTSADAGQALQPRLAPVYVLRADDAIVRFALPATDTLPRWMLTTEAGAQLAGEFDAASMSAYAAPDGSRWHRFEWHAPALADGYHQLTIDAGARHATTLIVAPAQCYTPPALRAGARLWGFTLQLYSLRSVRNWGIGDFTDLAQFVVAAAQAGAAVVGINPLHVLFAQRPGQASPYSPSSRLFLNTLYIDVTAIPDYAEDAAARARVEAADFQAELARLRACALVDYDGVARAKRPIFEALYAHFCRAHLAANDARAQAFRAFQVAGGATLQTYATYEALQEHFYAQDANLWGWPVWPADYRDPHAPAVQRFAAAQRQRCEFFQYLQWQADLQLAAATAAARSTGLAIGLYRDLAVGVDRGGAEAWSAQDLYALDASVGCPPDDFNLQGQNWGLPPVLPQALRAHAYTPFIETLRANMRHAGALRIDHVMGLMRLFWVPNGVGAREGSYVHYPLADLLGILALESQRQCCLVIGEDLGTVPDEIRGALAELGVLSYRLFFFERTAEGEFLPPPAYRAQALVAASTHDLATLAGFWAGQDIAERAALGLFPSADMAQQQTQARELDKHRLLTALARAGLIDADAAAQSRSQAFTPRLMQAIHAYLARTPAQVFLVQPEDVLMLTTPVNLPGTTDQRPNWRQKLPLDVTGFFSDPRLCALAHALQSERKSS